MTDLPSGAQVMSALVSWKASFVYGYLAWALFVHFRGRERHKFHRQLTDHSTIIAPYNAIMYGFSAVPNRPYVDVTRFPELKPLQDNWQMIRDEALKLFEDGHIRAAASTTISASIPSFGAAGNGSISSGTTRRCPRRTRCVQGR